jgi:hypothetical protein
MIKEIGINKENRSISNKINRYLAEISYEFVLDRLLDISISESSDTALKDKEIQAKKLLEKEDKFKGISTDELLMSYTYNVCNEEVLFTCSKLVGIEEINFVGMIRGRNTKAFNDHWMTVYSYEDDNGDKVWEAVGFSNYSVDESNKRLLPFMPASINLFSRKPNLTEKQKRRLDHKYVASSLAELINYVSSDQGEGGEWTDPEEVANLKEVCSGYLQGADSLLSKDYSPLKLHQWNMMRVN